MKRTPLKRGTAQLKRTNLKRYTPLRPRSPHRSKTERQDAEWRKSIYAKHGRRCVFSGQVTSCRCRGPLEVMHILGKQAFPHLRRHPLNGLPGCRAHHRWAHRNPAAAYIEFMKALGQTDWVTLQWNAQGMAA